MDKCIQFFGKEYITTPYPGYQEFVYYKKGIQLLFSDEALKTFKLFKPNANFLRLLEAKSKRIKEEFAEIDKEKGGSLKWPD
jgi:hypothetical protein